MAKVTIPSENFALFQSLGTAVTLRDRKEGFTVSRFSKPHLVSDEASELISSTAEKKLEEWRGLTEEQKQVWDALGAESYLDGVGAFMREAFKGQLQGYCGVARCGQNVCVAG